jgi:hypothetical protein
MTSVSHRGLGLPGEAALTSGSLVSFLQSGAGAVARTMQDKQREVKSITDYGTTNWRAAYLACHAELLTAGGGVMKFPASATRYTVNNTGLGALPWSDSIELVGDGKEASVLANVSTDGTPLLAPLAGASRNGLSMRSLKLEGDVGSGALVRPDATAGVGDSTWVDVWAEHLDPAQSVWHQETTPRGTFFHTFIGCRFQNGSGGSPPTVAAIRVIGVDNSFGAIRFFACRFQCNAGAKPVRLSNSSGGAFFPSVTFRDCDTEDMKEGLLYAEGTIALTIDRLGHYDCPDITGHVIEFANGSGGLANELATINGYLRGFGTLRELTGLSKSLTVSQVAGTATAVFASAHGIAVGQRFLVKGANQSGYNLTATCLTVTTTSVANDTLTYTVDPGTVSPGTGTITGGPIAQDIKLGPGDFRAFLRNIGGPGAASVEADLNGRSALLDGDNSRCLFSRVSATTTVVTGIGNEARIDTPVVNTDALAARTAGGNIAVSSMLAAAAGVEFGGGAEITDMRVGSAAIDFGSIAATGGTLESDVTVTGAGTTWRAAVQPQSALPAGVVLDWRVISDAVRLRVTNCTGAPIDPGSITFLVTAWKQ